MMIEKHKTSKWWELLRFIICGIASALTDYLFAQLIVLICGNNLNTYFVIVLSTMVGFIFGVLINYLISTFWVYQNVDKNVKTKSKKFICLFIILSFIAMLLSIGTMLLCNLFCVLIWGNEAQIIESDIASLISKYGINFLSQPSFWRYFISFIIKTLVGFIFNYFTRKKILYKEPKPTSCKESDQV